MYLHNSIRTRSSLYSGMLFIRNIASSGPRLLRRSVSIDQTALDHTDSPLQHKMAHRSGDAQAILLALALLAAVQAAGAKDIIVGGTQKWDFPPGTDMTYYDTWAAATSFAVGDNLVFQYQAGEHDVQLVSASEYNSCLASSNARLMSGFDTVPLPKAGDYYFICTFPIHCEQGMKLHVTVAPTSAPIVAPTIAPTVAPVIPPALPPSVLPPALPPSVSPPLVPSPSVKTPSPSPTAKAPVSGTVRKSSPIGLIGGLIAGFVAMALVLGLLILRCRRKGSCLGKLEPNKSSLELLDTTSRPFTYRELSSSTKNFSDTELLSSGGFGEVFKGTLPSGAFIAVKRIKRNKMQGEESFLAEATSLGQIRHRNLLRLRGWCQAKEGLLLVYDFMCNGSLDQWIYRPVSNGLEGENQSLDVDQGLSWDMRLSILAGTASGLVYLHEEWQQCILHRDIKASNVLLDASFNAYLGDFGLARLVDHGVMQKTTLLAGTLGYMAPEMQYTGRASIETDVYAFGILVLEVVCGRRALGSVAIEDSTEHYVLVESVWQAHEAGHILRVADPRLWNVGDDYGVDETTVGKVLQLGLLCCLPSPSERPSMRFVNHWFQTGARQELAWLPDRKPSLNLNVSRN